MRVIANEAFRFFYNHVPINVTEGEAIDSDVAVFLLTTRAAVRPDDEDAETLAAELGLDVTDDDQEQEPTTPPGGNGTPPTQPDELDIEASVADVLKWVGEDTERAAEALRQEQEKAKPRTTLVTHLTKIAEA
jgi:hypothetical protein